MHNQHSGIKILVVEDDPINMDILVEYLTAAGYEVITANDGDVALQKLDQYYLSISVIILDRMMPRLDGMEFLKIIKGDERFNKIPVIMQTAVTSSGRKYEAIRMGVYRYLSKPYDDDVMLDVVKSAIQDAKHNVG